MMRVAISTVQVPFIRGGAEIHAESLLHACRARGHTAEIITVPFQCASVADMQRYIDFCLQEDLRDHACSHMNMAVDKVIGLKFPAYAMPYAADKKVIWALHQHRSAYELWGVPHGGSIPETPEGQALRARIVALDTDLFRTTKAFANSKKVARRLLDNNGCVVPPLYHPPAHADLFYTRPAQPYIFYPSRLENLKRQDLLIEAMRWVASPVQVLLAGVGPEDARLRQLIDTHGVQHKVKLLGRVSDDELRALYANALAVFFGPHDEDYGYITLEAMLSAKAVITCTDSGGPLEFVVPETTGAVVSPEPTAIADAIDRLFANPKHTADMGQHGRQHYQAMGISWDNVLAHLLA